MDTSTLIVAAMGSVPGIGALIASYLTQRQQKEASDDNQVTDRLEILLKSQGEEISRLNEALKDERLERTTEVATLSKRISECETDKTTLVSRHQREVERLYVELNKLRRKIDGEQ